MNRRDTLKKLMVASGGLIALPSWAKDWHITQVSLHTTSFTPTQQEILASVADTIIPAGTSTGALSVGVDKFLQKLIDNCYEKDVQDNVRTQLLALETSAQKTSGRSFVNCEQALREELLLQMSNADDKAQKDFFDLMKSETIRGFITSREVMLNHLKYQLVPGHYYGCVDVNQ